MLLVAHRYGAPMYGAAICKQCLSPVIREALHRFALHRVVKKFSNSSETNKITFFRKHIESWGQEPIVSDIEPHLLK